MQRRTFVGLAAAGLAAAPRPLKLNVFSKHLQFLHNEALAEAAAELGFDGVDLTVRKGGHVEPEKAPQELPRLVKILRSRGLETPMVTTDIVDTETPHAAAVLGVLSDLGIRRYRWGGFRYAKDRPVAAQLDALRPRVEKLAEWNRKYGVAAMYHTHSGIGQVGASIWDLHLVLKDFDPAAVGVNYDVGHATIEGGFGGWINSFGITGRHLLGVALKDFLWEKRGSGDWRPKWTPVGEGMVRFAEFFRMLDAAGFQGPVQVHYEYDLGGADSGRRTLSIPKERVLAAMKADLARLRSYQPL